MSASSHYYDEDNSYTVSFNIVNSSTGAKLPLSSIGTLYCTQYYYNPDLLTSDPYHLATINNRYNQDVLNHNNVVVTSSGTVSWTIQQADVAKLNTDVEEELHIALFVWQYSGNQNHHAFFNYVRAVPYLSDIP